MTNIRSANEIVLSILDFLRVAQPDLSLNPGSVARDIAVDLPASQMALLYDELSKISSLQSLKVSVGTDLDKLAQNFGAQRKTSTKSTGIALLTFNSIPASIPIDKGSLIFASNGASFAVLNGTSVEASLTNLYKSTATKFRNDLDFVGITDQFAVEIIVEATSPGATGNVSKYSLVQTAISAVSNVTNVAAFTGGADQEDDASFRNRVLAIFSGSNLGTSLGYRNIALSDPNTLDAIVIEPGDPLMTRDGTQVTQNSDGSFTIVSEGQGGKVDIIVLGNKSSEHIDSFIYRDLSNKNDPTDTKNIIVLGQIAEDVNKTVTRKRIDDIANGVLPSQPVGDIVEVTGSLSGSNFASKVIDEFGRVSGNYELIKDTGVYTGSPFGFDKFHWISNYIALSGEDKTKSQFNGQDTLTFSDVISIPTIEQNLIINNENSIVDTNDRSIIQLLHTPATSVTRVFNVNTGERYTVIDQNFDGSSSINTTGRIQISGNTLPSASDTLQVDYTWIVSYDPYMDFDGKFLNNNPRTVTDSIDWGFSNMIRKEQITLTKNTPSTFFVGNVNHNISTIIHANVFSFAHGRVSIVIDPLSPLFGKKIISLATLVNPITDVHSIVFKNTNKELYITAANDGSFTNVKVIVGITIRYNATIVLPSDTVANDLDYVSVLFNTQDIFTVSGISGNISGTQITIPTANFSTSATSIIAEIVYVGNIQEMFSSNITTLPTSRIGNGFILNSKVGFNNIELSNVYRREHQLVQQNGSNFFVKLSIPATEYNLTASNILTAIRITDNVELLNADNAGTVSVDTDGKYLITFNGFHSPALNNKVLIIYYASDLKRTQPFTFSNFITKKNITSLSFDPVNDVFFTPIHIFVNETLSCAFQIIDPLSNIVYASGTDGYITANVSNTSIAGFKSIAVNFSSIENITYKKIKILNSPNPNNNGIYDIYGFNSSTNVLTISNILDNIDKAQISVIRISDGQELWSTAGSLDTVNNILTLPGTNFPVINDKVVLIFNIFNNLRQSGTKLAVTVSDQINTIGVFTVSGTTITKAKDIVFLATNDGLKQDISNAIRTALGINSSVSIPSDIKLVRIVKLEQVETTGTEVLSILNTYDIEGTKIKNNSLFYNETINDLSLTDFELILPATSKNVSITPVIGSNLRLTFYYSTSNDTENLFFTRNGTLYTNKVFAFLDAAYISSGFGASSSTKITINDFNQPSTNSRYKASYNYLAPKQNERIIIRYNYNKLISDVTFDVETQRPINADILIRAATQILVDVTINIVVTTDVINTGTTQTVVQNLRDKIIGALNINTLGSILDSSDLINTAYSVSGVDRARILYFNRTGHTGSVLSIVAQKNEYFVANNVIINIETR